MYQHIYCHFSFRRPKGENFALFAVAFYTDEEGTNLLCHMTRAYPMWADHQYICAIQAYEHALYCIWENQAEIIRYGVKTVYLVTDNSALSKWIADPNKNKTYAPYMQRALKNYRYNQPKAIELNIGLCETHNLEKSHKYCKIHFVQNKLPLQPNPKTVNKLQVDTTKSVQDYIKSTEVPITNITPIGELQ